MTGGRCAGYSFVQEHFEENKCHGCRSCNHFEESEFECQVANRVEDAHECPELADFLDRNEVPVPKQLRRKSWS